MTTGELEKIARHVSSKHTGRDQEELFQIGYLAGLEAREKGNKVYGAVKSAIGHHIATEASPVAIPKSSGNHSALAKLRRGEAPQTPSERRIASVLGPQEDVLPISAITKDHPESLLIEREIATKLEDFLKYDSLYLTQQQRDALGVVFFGHPIPEEYCKKYGVGKDSIYWHKEQALIKLRKVLK